MFRLLHVSLEFDSKRFSIGSDDLTGSSQTHNVAIDTMQVEAWSLISYSSDSNSVIDGRNRPGDQWSLQSRNHEILDLLSATAYVHMEGWQATNPIVCIEYTMVGAYTVTTVSFYVEFIASIYS